MRVLSPVDEASDLVPYSAVGVIVAHGATAGTARPTGATTVIWIGSVTPSNAIDGDLFVNTA